jgi:peptidoglycan/xylan/chitin deacetylase (PgdA/CDA1 family)
LSSKGIFSISLDFELNWGCFESKLLDDSGKLYFKNTRNSIPKLLALFTEFKVEVTWAIVGMLFNENKEEWTSNIPSSIPNYSNPKRSSYEWVKSQKNSDQIGECLFAPALIELIQSTPGMEVGTHTYSHFYCKEQGQTIEDFKADLEKAIEVARKKNIQLTSLVFPRNQFNSEYLSVCSDLGIHIVRSNPSPWYWNSNKPESLLKKIFRTGDSWLPLNRNTVVELHSLQLKDQSLLLPASRLYRPWTKNALLNKLKMIRIKNEMTSAAKNKAYYHLWWHPHNFGNHPDECLEELKIILKHYNYLNKKFGFTSLNMRSTANYLKTPE